MILPVGNSSIIPPGQQAEKDSGLKAKAQQDETPEQGLAESTEVAPSSATQRSDIVTSAVEVAPAQKVSNAPRTAEARETVAPIASEPQGLAERAVETASRDTAEMAARAAAEAARDSARRDAALSIVEDIAERGAPAADNTEPSLVERAYAEADETTTAPPAAARVETLL